MATDEIMAGNTWAFTRVEIPASRRHDLEGVVQILAGYVAERLFAPQTIGDEDIGTFGPADAAVNYVASVREDDGEKGDLASAFEVLEFHLGLPSADEGVAAELERTAALEWAVRCTCRLVLPSKETILLVADRVETLAPGSRLEGAEIVRLCESLPRYARRESDAAMTRKPSKPASLPVNRLFRS